MTIDVRPYNISRIVDADYAPFTVQQLNASGYRVLSITLLQGKEIAPARYGFPKLMAKDRVLILAERMD